MTPADQIVAYMDANPGTSARKAAEALSLSPKDARAARKQRNARARAGEVVALAPPPVKPVQVDVTATPVPFWSQELRILADRRDMAGDAGSWVAFAQLTRQLHIAREQYEAAVAAAPPPAQLETDDELLQELAEHLGELPEAMARRVTG